MTTHGPKRPKGAEVPERKVLKATGLVKRYIDQIPGGVDAEIHTFFDIAFLFPNIRSLVRDVDKRYMMFKAEIMDERKEDRVHLMPDEGRKYLIDLLEEAYTEFFDHYLSTVALLEPDTKSILNTFFGRSVYEIAVLFQWRGTKSNRGPRGQKFRAAGKAVVSFLLLLEKDQTVTLKNMLWSKCMQSVIEYAREKLGLFAKFRHRENINARSNLFQQMISCAQMLGNQKWIQLPGMIDEGPWQQMHVGLIDRDGRQLSWAAFLENGAKWGPDKQDIHVDDILDDIPPRYRWEESWAGWNFEDASRLFMRIHVPDDAETVRVVDRRFPQPSQSRRDSNRPTNDTRR